MSLTIFIWYILPMLCVLVYGTLAARKSYNEYKPIVLLDCIIWFCGAVIPIMNFCICLILIGSHIADYLPSPNKVLFQKKR